jgi:murein DD-endopeptidase MepM/ murein hydrolase activator NlpD
MSARYLALLRRGAASVLLLGVAGLLAAGRAAAADDYSLPFFDPAVTLSYGMDRDPAVARQLDWTGQAWTDEDLHYGRVYDQHRGLDYPMSLLSPIAAARSGTVVDSEGGFGTSQFGVFGNFILLEHAGNRRTLYYHLASADDGGLSVGLGEAVLAGQPIGRSGCSGQCYGAHLHFELRGLNTSTGSWYSIDPLWERRWTTWPGRVPWLASYVRESNPYAELMRRNQTITHWVEFRNTGGRTWRGTGSAAGRLDLATWSPAYRGSAFRASDWLSSWLASPVDAGVAPDGTGRFTFGLRAAVVPGSYVERFNLLAETLRWFDYARLGSFYVPIIVSDETL